MRRPVGTPPPGESAAPPQDDTKALRTGYRRAFERWRTSSLRFDAVSCDSRTPSSPSPRRSAAQALPSSEATAATSDPAAGLPGSNSRQTVAGSVPPATGRAVLSAAPAPPRHTKTQGGDQPFPAPAGWSGQPRAPRQGWAACAGGAHPARVRAARVRPARLRPARVRPTRGSAQLEGRRGSRQRSARGRIRPAAALRSRAPAARAPRSARGRAGARGVRASGCPAGARGGHAGGRRWHAGGRGRYAGRRGGYPGRRGDPADAGGRDQPTQACFLWEPDRSSSAPSAVGRFTPHAVAKSTCAQRAQARSCALPHWLWGTCRRP
jgi:hypothetical protein